MLLHSTDEETQVLGVCVQGPARLGLFGVRQSQRYLAHMDEMLVSSCRWHRTHGGALLLLFATGRQVFHGHSTDLPCIVLQEAGKSPEGFTSLTNTSYPHATTHISIFSTVYTGSGTLAASLIQIQVYY